MDNLKTLQEYLETTVSENNNINNINLNETSDNNMTAVGGGSLSETSNNNMTAVGGGVLSETSNNNMTAVGGGSLSETSDNEETKNDNAEDKKKTGGFFSKLFIKSNTDNTINNDLLKLLETTETSISSPVNNNINTATMDNQVAKLFGGENSITESLTTEAMEQQLKKLLGGKKN